MTRRGIIVGGAVGVIVVSGVFFALMTQPPAEDTPAQVESASPGAPIAAEPVQVAAWEPEIGPFDRSLGSADAPVTVIEYASFTCGHCADFHAETLPALKEAYIDTGAVRFVFRDFPLNEPALRAGMMARCVPEEQYFNVVDVVFQTLNQWSSGPNWMQSLSRIGRMAGLSQQAFDACMADTQLEEKILALRLEGANKFNVQATPSFVVNGKTLSGGRSIDEFAEIIDRATE